MFLKDITTFTGYDPPDTRGGGGWRSTFQEAECF